MGINSLEKSIFKKNNIDLNLPQSIFDVNMPVKDSFMCGRLVPIGAPIPVLPHDVWTLKLNGLMRTGSAMIAPVLDDIYLDVFSFWVPDRIVWNRFAQFLGENDANAWDTSLPDLDVPSIRYRGVSMADGAEQDFYTYNTETSEWDTDAVFSSADNQTWLSSVSISNYFLLPHQGLPYRCANDEDGLLVSALESRGYYYIWNEFFRFTEWQRPVLFSKGDTGYSGEFGYQLDDIYVRNIAGTRMLMDSTVSDPSMALLMPVNRFLDNFTSIKPEPQFQGAVDLFANTNLTAPVGLIAPINGTSFTSGITPNNSDNLVKDKFYQLGRTFTPTQGADPVGAEVFADLSNLSLEIEKVRQGLLLQNYREVLGRTDARATSIIKTLFGLKFTDFEDDRPRLLNHSRVRVGVNQIVATADSSTSGGVTSHLGETGAYSITGVSANLCKELFNEPGHIHTLVAVRHKNTYSQGVPEQYLRLERLDRYNSIFDRIGMVPYKAVYINAMNNPDVVIGYQLGNYSYKSNRGYAIGALDPSIPDSYNFWTLGTVYEPFSALAGIGPGTFIQTPTELDRALIANHEVAPQFIADWCISGTVSRVMSKDADPLVLGMRL